MADSISSKAFRFDLVSPERVVLSEEMTMVVVPGVAGDFGVLANHAPVVSSIRPGVVLAQAVSGEVKKIFVADGFVDMSGNLCSLLAQDAVPVADINRAEVEDSLKKLREDLGAAGEDAIRKAKILRDIDAAQVKLAALQ